jgi:multidrug efflux system outer membrane protein
MDPCAHDRDDGVCGIMKTMAQEPLQVLALVGAIVMISGCMIKPYVLTDEDVRTRATNDLQIVSTLREPLSGPIDLYEAIARALKFNLDAKVKAMQAQLAHQQLNVAHYTLLPQLSANAGI